MTEKERRQGEEGEERKGRNRRGHREVKNGGKEARGAKKVMRKRA